MNQFETDQNQPVVLRVNDKKIEVEAGTNLLKGCLDNGIYIPNLCYIEGMEHPPASCRLCFVEIEGRDDPVPACAVKVSGEITVVTDTPRVRRLQQSALNLLLSVHRIDCKNCPANKKCALQDMARFLKVGLKAKELDTFLKESEVDETHYFIDYYPNRCVLCGRCVYVCRQHNSLMHLTFAGRGFNTLISSFGDRNSDDSACASCSACIEACPVAALVPKSLN